MRDLPTLAVRRLLPAVLIASCLGSLACAPGAIKREPPIHPNYNMDDLNRTGQRYDPQEAHPRFLDGRVMRTPPVGTVARGTLRLDAHLWTGKDAEGNLVSTLPGALALDQGLLQRGRERYGIYCAPCHDVTGSGQGPVVARGYLPPPSLHDARLRAVPVGHFFDVITNGIRNMPAYGPQVPAEDRWAIAAYVRALQVSRSATLDAVPPAIREAKGWTQ
jgi:mono/diheme cytochrome c family protein